MHLQFNLDIAVFYIHVCRVAFLILTEDDFCYNSRQQLGHARIRRRHLEILGYRIVEVIVTCYSY